MDAAFTSVPLLLSVVHGINLSANEVSAAALIPFAVINATFIGRPPNTGSVPKLFPPIFNGALVDLLRNVDIPIYPRANAE